MPKARKTIIIHLGAPKTGSSAIQSSLALNIEVLRANGIDYPEHPSFLNAREGRISSGNINATPEWVTIIRDKARSSAYETVLFSSEGLFHTIPQRVSDLRDLANEFDLKLVALLRNPVESLCSRYGQMVKRGGETGSLDDYVLRDTGLQSTLNVIEAIYDNGLSLHLRNYSSIAPKLLTEFADMIGLNSDALTASLPAAIVNRSLSRSELKLQRSFNSHYGRNSSAFISDALVNYCPDLPSERPPLQEATYMSYLEQIAPIVAKINAFLPTDEKMEVEAFDPSWQDFDQDRSSFTDRQIDVVARAISNRMKRLEADVADRQKRVEQLEAEVADRQKRVEQLEANVAIGLLSVKSVAKSIVGSKRYQKIRDWNLDRLARKRGKS